MKKKRWIGLIAMIAFVLTMVTPVMAAYDAPDDPETPGMSFDLFLGTYNYVPIVDYAVTPNTVLWRDFIEQEWEHGYDILPFDEQGQNRTRDRNWQNTTYMAPGQHCGVKDKHEALMVHVVKLVPDDGSGQYPTPTEHPDPTYIPQVPNRWAFTMEYLSMVRAIFPGLPEYECEFSPLHSHLSWDYELFMKTDGLRVTPYDKDGRMISTQDTYHTFIQAGEWGVLTYDTGGTYVMPVAILKYVDYVDGSTWHTERPWPWEEPQPTPTPTATPTSTPPPTPTPTQTQYPVVTPEPSPTQSETWYPATQTPTPVAPTQNPVPTTPPAETTWHPAPTQEPTNTWYPQPSPSRTPFPPVTSQPTTGVQVTSFPSMTPNPTPTQTNEGIPTPTVTPGTTKTPEPTQKPEPTKAPISTSTLAPSSQDKLSVSGVGAERFVLGVDAHTPVTVKEFISDMSVPAGHRLTILKPDGTRSNGSNKVATGHTAVLEDRSGNELDRATIVVKGDVLGTGQMSIAQLVRTAQAASGERPLSGAYLKAATDGDRVTIADLVRVARQLNE